MPPKEQPSVIYLPNHNGADPVVDLLDSIKRSGNGERAKRPEDQHGRMELQPTALQHLEQQQPEMVLETTPTSEADRASSEFEQLESAKKDLDQLVNLLHGCEGSTSLVKSAQKKIDEYIHMRRHQSK